MSSFAKAPVWLESSIALADLPCDGIRTVFVLSSILALRPGPAQIWTGTVRTGLHLLAWQNHPTDRPQDVHERPNSRSRNANSFIQSLERARLAPDELDSGILVQSMFFVLFSSLVFFMLTYSPSATTYVMPGPEPPGYSGPRESIRAARSSARLEIFVHL